MSSPFVTLVILVAEKGSRAGRGLEMARFTETSLPTNTCALARAEAA
jgi:hypothetical protein